MVLQVLGVPVGQEVLCVLMVQVDLGVLDFQGVQGLQGDQVVLLVVQGVCLLQVDLILVNVFYHLGIHYLLDLHLVIPLLLFKGLQIFSLQVVDLYQGLLLQVGNHRFLLSMEVVLHLCLLDSNDNVILHCVQGNLSSFVS